VSVRGDSRLLGHDQARIVRVIDDLLEVAFPGVSGFKYERRPPHRVEGGACLPLSNEQEMRFHLTGAAPSAEGNGLLQHCRDLARTLVAALRDLKVAKPEDVAGLL
jgi:hypothetical protein